MKSDVKADECRIEGNKFYLKEKFYEALVAYNKSLCFSASQLQLSLAYANRSAVYLKLKQFEHCMRNIQFARDNKYPHDAKLDEREQKCKAQMETQQHKTKNDPWTFFKLSYPPNEKIPFIVNCLELNEDEKYGRHIVTNRDLQPGDVIAIEDHVFQNVTKSALYQRCAYCFESNKLDLIPCSKNNEKDVCTTGNLTAMTHKS